MQLELYNHQLALELEDSLLGRLERLGQVALDRVLQLPEGEVPVLESLEVVEVSFIDDATIARVHEEFMAVAGATDVITFHHGEILISTETARTQAEEHDESVERELFRYLVHGLLHLHGYTDTEPSKRAAMHDLQEKLVLSLWR